MFKWKGTEPNRQHFFWLLLMSTNTSYKLCIPVSSLQNEMAISKLIIINNYYTRQNFCNSHAYLRYRADLISKSTLPSTLQHRSLQDIRAPWSEESRRGFLYGRLWLATSMWSSSKCLPSIIIQFSFRPSLKYSVPQYSTSNTWSIPKEMKPVQNNIQEQEPC